MSLWRFGVVQVCHEGSCNPSSGAAAKGRIQKKKFEELAQGGGEPAQGGGEEARHDRLRDCPVEEVRAEEGEAMSGAHGLDTMGGELLVATKKRVRAEVGSWTGDQCSDFLTSVTAMRPYSSTFSAINGKAILRMSINSLSSIGITQFEHQRVIWAAVAELQQFCNQIEYVPADEVLSA
ncbi:SAM domain-containing protein [Chloropicon roscoffensis]|uniref:SAM domain-containing protein n=1 Tax=Chloropicon roscoffensis TaxID=1461544 RepID=A0AAX4PBB3_9CHLO